MRVIETKVYKFNELSNEAKARAISDYIVFEQEVFEADLSEYKGYLKEKGFSNCSIAYSGFYSQGDGASFDGLVNITHFLKKYKDQVPKLYKIFNSSRNLYDYINVNIRKNSYANRYDHKKTRYTEISLESLDPRVEKVLLKEVRDFQDLIESDRLEACDYIYSDLESQWDSISSEENAKETIEANEYEFFENGKMV